MRKLITLLLLTISLQALMSQPCSNCTPVYVPTCPPTGGLCSKLDTAYANNPFDKVINFYMPKFINSPALLAQCGGCSSIQLRQIDVVGVSGLPGGFQIPAIAKTEVIMFLTEIVWDVQDFAEHLLFRALIM